MGEVRRWLVLWIASVATMGTWACGSSGGGAAESGDGGTEAGTCGNGALDPGEECDGEHFPAGVSCETLGYASGSLACTPGCRLDKSGCSGTASRSCGDGTVQADQGEQCDGTNLGESSCESLGLGDGILACDESCHYDTSGCERGAGRCGDGIVQSVRGEDCDGTNLAGATCKVLGYSGGTLSCDGACHFDLSGCQADPCGNGKIDPGEECDGSDFGGQTCKKRGYASGNLTCTKDCKIDESGCHSDPGTCGDHKITGTEKCDHDNLGGKTCQSLTFVNQHVSGGKETHYGSGTLACSKDCQSFDTSGCVEGYVGDPCTSAGNCPTVRGWVHLHNPRCLTKTSNGVDFPGGYCTATCETGRMSYCCKLAAGECVVLPQELGGDGSLAICLKPCFGASSCRDGYECKKVGTKQYCLPK